MQLEIETGNIPFISTIEKKNYQNKSKKTIIRTK